MRKKVLAVVLLIVMLMSITGCGFGRYTCAKCDATTMKAYYTMSANPDHVMCEDCARKYWMPLPIENYRVK